MFKFEKKLNKSLKVSMIILSSLIIIFVIIYFSFNYLLIQNQGDVERHIDLDIFGRIDLSFGVYYQDRTQFPINPFNYNPIDSDLFFLMSFTDRIEVSSIFSSNFSERIEGEFTYTVAQRMYIRYMSTADGNLNPIVFRTIEPLFETQRGRFTYSISYDSYGNEIISFMAIDDIVRESHIVRPEEFIQQYLEFREIQREQMHSRGLYVQTMRDFSAELFIDFMYGIYIPDRNINETIKYSYRLPLSTEVYTITPVGISTFELSSEIPVLNGVERYQQATLTISTSIFYITILGVCSFILFYNIKKLKPSSSQNILLSILKKYSNEIFISDSPLPLSECIIINAQDFDSILNLAITSNKYIICYHYINNYAEFAVYMEQYVHYIKISYNEDNIVEDFEIPIEIIEREKRKGYFHINKETKD